MKSHRSCALIVPDSSLSMKEKRVRSQSSTSASSAALAMQWVNCLKLILGSTTSELHLKQSLIMDSGMETFKFQSRRGSIPRGSGSRLRFCLPFSNWILASSKISSVSELFIQWKSLFMAVPGFDLIAKLIRINGKQFKVVQVSNFINNGVVSQHYQGACMSNLDVNNLKNIQIMIPGLGNLGNLRLGMNMGEGIPESVNKPDTSEQIYISSLALLKMLKHCRAGVPLEVMGLMLGESIDQYTIKVVDVFAMPQSGNLVSVESVDPVYQKDMLDMLKQTQRNENVVGWYHSHPSFSCWLSSVDMSTQESFEQLNPKCVAVVIDPIQSVRGKVVIDAFRLIDKKTLMSGQEPRQTTSVNGHLNKPSIEAMFKGLNKYYYSININYRTNELEQKMLLNLYKQKWNYGLKLNEQTKITQHSHENFGKVSKLAVDWAKRIDDETKENKKQLQIKNTGKLDPKRHISETIEETVNENILGVLGGMISTKSF